MSDNLKGACITVFAVLLYTLNDGIMKLVVAEIPLFQAVFLRSLFMLPLMGLLAWQMKAIRWQISKAAWRVSVLRGFNEIALTFCLLQAFRYMLLADAIAILQAAPVLLTIVAAVFFKEHVSKQRWIAVLIGLFGVLVIIRPVAGAFNEASFYAIAGVCLVTLRDSMTRTLPKGTPDLFPALVTGVIVFIFSALLPLFSLLVSPVEVWVTPPPSLFLYLFGAAIFIFAATYFSITMMRIGDLGFVSSFRYFAIIWSALLGLLIFGEWPDAFTWGGAAILVVSGIYLVKNR